MYKELNSQRHAIRFRRLFLETLSSGILNSKTTWRLAYRLNLTLLNSREVLASMAIVSAVFLFAMPFGSHELTLVQRLIYFATSVLTIFAGVFLFFLPFHFCVIKEWISGVISMAIVVVFTLFFAAACLAFYRDLYGLPLDISFWEIMLRVSPMVLSIFGTIHRLSPFTAKRLMRRNKRSNLTQLIDKSKRGQLIAVSVQENYVEVTTSAGTDLLRMSLAAAMKLIEPGIGLQIHRSHWVAISAVKSVDEQNRAVELINGQTLPVSTTYMPNLTLELSRKDNYSQLSGLFERKVGENSVLKSLSTPHKEAREKLDRMFLELHQGKAIDERVRVRIAYQIFRLSTTDFTYLGVQLTLFCGLAFLGTYGLYDLPWYQPPLFWALGYFFCFFVTVVAHVFVWYMDLKYGSKGWLGPVLLTFTEATSSGTVLYVLSLVLFGPVMVPYLVFLISSYFLHTLYAPIVHMIVREHQSFASWKTALNVPPIVLQLPFEVRGELVSISANGRAVDVATTTGTSTIKKKFSEAMKMIGDRKGIQVHRSHWVASEYIRGRSIKGGLNFVELKTGEYVPLAAANTGKLDVYLNKSG